MVWNESPFWFIWGNDLTGFAYHYGFPWLEKNLFPSHHPNKYYQKERTTWLIAPIALQPNEWKSNYDINHPRLPFIPQMQSAHSCKKRYKYNERSHQDVHVLNLKSTKDKSKCHQLTFCYPVGIISGFLHYFSSHSLLDALVSNLLNGQSQ